MPSDFEKTVERYKAELMKYGSLHRTADDAAPAAAPTPDTPAAPQPVSTPDIPMPTNTPEMPLILPGEPNGVPMTEPADQPMPPMTADMTDVIGQSDIPISDPVGGDEGYLQVRATTAENALPIEGALVTVTDKNGYLVAAMLTDEDGLTRTVSLSTVPRAESESPEYDAPFDTYTVTVNKEDYSTLVSERLPIFGGVTNMQEFALVPLPEFSDGDVDTVQNTEPDL